jgi:hypothetical protein
MAAVRFLVALAATAAAARALAGLGEPEASIAADQAALAAARAQGTARGLYRVEHLVARTRTVREYVSPDGVVFAVCWEGVSHPDLAAVLGAYAAPVRRAPEQDRGRARRRAARRLETAGVVVETWGHQRAIHGRAFVPDLVPAGVRLDELR